MQSKKLMKMPRIILIIICGSLFYWLYLALNASMLLANDALGYDFLGRLLKEKGFVAYFQSGPNREPLYPSLVALSMHLEHLSGIAYVRLMAFAGVVILLINQCLAFRILTMCKVRTSISALILAYFGVSPALNNMAFSLYSEISATTFILLLILTIARSFRILTTKPRQNLLTGLALGLLFFAVTMVKSIFEVIFALFMGAYLILLVISFLKKNRTVALNIFLLVLAACFAYQLPVHTYKTLNFKYNGHYAITDRGAWAFYGSCALRAEPLTPQRFLTALAHIPGKGACAKFFSEEDCLYWEPQHSDSFGMPKLSQVAQTTPPQEVNNTMMKLAKEKIMENPFQFVLFTLIDGIKMFFWESTQIGFVQYPPWMEKLYAYGPFKDGIRLLVSLLSLAAFLYLSMSALSTWGRFLNSAEPVMPCESLLMAIFPLLLFYIGLYALFNTVPRFALPVAPLYLIWIGMAAHAISHKKGHPNGTT